MYQHKYIRTCCDGDVRVFICIRLKLSGGFQRSRALIIRSPSTPMFYLLKGDYCVTK